MTEVIIAHDKDGTFTYSSAFSLLRERVDQGIYYDNWDDGDSANQWEDRARNIIDLPTEDGGAMRKARAWAFLRERSDFEYEGVEKQVVQ